jgi:hypothetical protein
MLIDLTPLTVAPGLILAAAAATYLWSGNARRRAAAWRLLRLFLGRRP